MPHVERPDGARIYYEVIEPATRSDALPLLALAPDFVNSEVASWERAPFDPRKAFGDRRVVVMDQRHAGRSPGPGVPFHYDQTAGDQLAVLDAAGIERALVLGWGIGANYALRLAHDAPERIAAAALVEPLGREGLLLSPFYALFFETMRLTRAEGLEAVIAAAIENPSFRDNPGAGPYARRLHDDEEFRQETLRKGRERYVVRVVRFRDGMFPDDTVYFSVPEAWVASCPAPLAVIPGRDDCHPRSVAQRLAHDAPKAWLVDLAADDPSAREAITRFLREHEQ